MLFRVLVVAVVAAGATAPVHSQRAPQAHATEQRGGAPEQAPPVRVQLTDPSLLGGTPEGAEAVQQALRARAALLLATRGRVSCPTVVIRPDPGVEHAVREVEPDERVDYKIRRLAPTACVE